MIPEFSGDFIQWLRGFYYTVELGSLVKATTVMNRNQSALTYQIQSLESLYGVSLFTSGKGKRELTHEGKFLYSKVIELFSEINDIRAVIDKSPHSEAGEVRVAAPNSVLEHFLPRYISAFRTRFPGANFILEGVDSARTALNMLASRQTDFAILCSENIPESYEMKPLFTSEVLLVTPKTGPYAFTEPLLERLVEVPFIAPPAHSSLGTFLRSQFAYLGLEMHKEIVSSYSGGAKAFVAQGLGIAFVWNFSVNEDDVKNLNILPMRPIFKSMSFGVIHRRSMAKTFLHEAFLQCLEQPPEQTANQKHRTGKKVRS